MTGKTRILVAPLDWGLGHATRCIPLIRELIRQGAEPWLAGEGAQKKILLEEFPQLPFLPLKGYRVRYAGTAAGMAWQMFRQVPKMKEMIRYEQEWLNETVQKYRFDAVISDNRYGLYHAEIPSVIITHQLLIKTGWGKWTERVLQEKNYRYLNRFSECWVPDDEGPLNFAGALSHPNKMPGVPVRYAGLLSRFRQEPVEINKGKLLILLSGPEPQRSILEKILFDQIGEYPGLIHFLRGLPEEKETPKVPENTTVYNHLESGTLNRLMSEAEYLLCRSGYSSVMDAMILGKKCIFIPTPGQTEQEYLGSYLQEKGIALSFAQKNFSLEEALKLAVDFEFRLPAIQDSHSLPVLVRNFLARVQAEALG